MQALHENLQKVPSPSEDPRDQHRQPKPRRKGGQIRRHRIARDHQVRRVAAGPML